MISKRGFSLITRNSLIRHSGKCGELLCGRELAVATSRNFWYGPKRVPICDLSKQSILQEDGSRKAAWIGDGPLQRTAYDECLTTTATYKRGLKMGGKEMMGVRVKEGDELVWKWITYEQAFKRADNIAQAMRKLGIPTGDDTRIGIYSKNRPEWILAEMSTSFFSNVNVPLYDTTTLENMIYMLNLCEIPLVFVDTEVKTKSIVHNASMLPSLKYIVQFNQVDEKLKTLAMGKGIKLWSQVEFESMGEHVSQGEHKPHVLPTPETIATISFTSGTTGKPKGVILTHKNLCTSLIAGQEFYWPDPGFTYLSYLPLAHVFERVMSLMNFAHGAKLGFYRGEQQHVFEDMQSLHPTTLAAVPRVADRIHKSVLHGLQGNPVKQMIFNAAMAYKNYLYQKTGFISRDSVVDRWIFAKCQSLLGKNMKQMIVGAAKSDPATLYFLQNAMGIRVFQAYGQTETSAPLCIQLAGDTKFGNVGPPMACSLVKLVDVPELGYFVDKNGGELLVKGHNVTSGYFKNEKATKEAFDEDGYMKTGDIARFNEDGALEIIDRRKNVFKLPQGEFVACEEVESTYLTSPFVSQIYVHGETNKPWLVAVIVPDPVYLASYAEQKHNIKGLSYEELCKNEVLSNDVTQQLIKITEEHNRPRYEGIYGVHLTTTAFTPDNDLTTSTMKNKRKNVGKHFQAQIDALFKKIEKNEAAKLAKKLT